MTLTPTIKRLSSAVRRWQRKQRDLDDIAALGPRTYADTGVSRGDWASIVHGAADTRERLEAMMEKLAIPAASFGEERWRAVDMVRTCANCGTRRACRRWLNGRGGADEYHAFCPNAQSLDELRRRAQQDEGPVTTRR